MSEEKNNATLSEEDLQAMAARMAKRKAKPRRKDESGDLNINSMMDIMTILLVFLLVSVSSDPLAIKESNILKLARSSMNFPAVYTIPLQVNKKEILVDGKKALPVQCRYQGRPCEEEDYERPEATFRIDDMNKEHGKSESLLIVPLKESIAKAVKKLKDQNMSMPEDVRKKYESNQGVATIVCDRDIPYRLLAEVVYTTAMAELHDVRFAVVYATGGG